MNKIVFGVTGALGSGKSSFSLACKTYLKSINKDITLIDLDDIRREALWWSTKEHHIQLRKDLSQIFCLTTNTDFFWFDREVFTNIIFSHADSLALYSQIATPFLKYDVEQKIKEGKETVAIIWTYLLEENYDSLINSSVVIIECNEENITKRLLKNNEHSSNELSINELSINELNQRRNLESSHDKRIKLAHEKTIPYLIFNNDQNKINREILPSIYQQLINSIKNNEQLIQYRNDLSFCKFRIPENSGRVIWEITNECNYGCKYCIFASTGKKPHGELNTNEVFSVIKELVKEGFTHVKFTGGEPFLREDMVEILKYASHCGLQYDISTNASKITDSIAQELKMLNIPFIHVSLDGADADSHEAVRGKKSFSPTMQGIQLLRKYNIPLRVGCVIHEHNQNSLLDIVQLCAALNIHEVVFSMMEPVGRLKGKTTSLSNKPIKDIINDISNIKKLYPYLHISHNLESLHKIDLTQLTSSHIQKTSVACPAGKQFLFINSLGVVSPCTWVSEHRPNFVGGKIQDSNLNTVLNSRPILSMRKLADTVAELNESICPMSDLTTTKNIENALYALNLNNHKDKFGQFAPIYRFTTENLEYLQSLPIKNKEILTIGGSYDHCIDLALMQAQNVENIDINLCAKYYAQLKHTALLHLDYSTFKTFLGNNENSFNRDIFKQIQDLLPLEAKLFFTEMLKKFNHGTELLNSPYFHNRNYQDSLSHSLYLKNESQYLLAQENIKKQSFIWHSQAITSISNLQQYDIILLSNIADYSHKMFHTQEHAKNFRDNIVLPLTKHLKPNGIIMFAYVFDALNILNSDQRNHFNLSEIRSDLYGSIPGFSFKEYDICSSIKTAMNDCVCLLTKE